MVPATGAAVVIVFEAETVALKKVVPALGVAVVIVPQGLGVCLFETRAEDPVRTHGDVAALSVRGSTHQREGNSEDAEQRLTSGFATTQLCHAAHRCKFAAIRW